MDSVMPQHGAWVLIKRQLPTRIQVPLLSVFFGVPEKLFPEGSFSPGYWGAEPTYYRLFKRERYSRKTPPFASEQQALRAIWAFRRGELDQFDPLIAEHLAHCEECGELPDIEFRLRITTPDGEVCIEPHEYSPLSDLSIIHEAIGNEYEIELLGGMENDQDFRNQLFYAQSRGIPTSAALPMLLGQITTPDVCWFRPHEQLAQAMGLAA